MLYPFLIMFREGIEDALLVGIIAISQTNGTDVPNEVRLDGGHFS
jgi:high-affinity Fe2+/Pb2+ permease